MNETLATTTHQTVSCRDVTVAGREGTRLRRMGFCPGRVIHLVQRGNPMIVEVVGTTIGISRELADTVLVAPITAEASLDPTSQTGGRDA